MDCLDISEASHEKTTNVFLLYFIVAMHGFTACT
jgi:hypothetical protein